MTESPIEVIEANEQKPAFEPSELIEHGDAADLTRAGVAGFADGVDYS